MYHTVVGHLHTLQRDHPEKPGAPLTPCTAKSALGRVHYNKWRSLGGNLTWLFFSWQQLELVEPSGWIHVPLTDNHKKPTRTFMIQIAVLANHQNGRDTHMRQIKIYTPVEESSIGKFPRCTTIDFMMYRSIRWPGDRTEVIEHIFVLSGQYMLYLASLLKGHQSFLYALRSVLL